jgi:hypothetical protein
VIELVYSAGGGRVCETGDVLWLDGLPVRALRNTRDEPVVLVAVSRRDTDRGLSPTATDQFSADLSSQQVRPRAWVAPTTRGLRP